MIEKRKTILNKNLIRYVTSVKEALQESRRRYEVKLKFDQDMKNMTGSLDNVESEIRYDNVYQGNLQIWIQEKVKRYEKMKKQFEPDTVFYFSRDTWNNLKGKQIWLSYKNLTINGENFNKVEKGIKLDWCSIRKLRNIDRIAMMDAIDKSRANREYLDLLKEMKMNQRVSYIEKWLLSKE
jgi:hypothetical protein